MKVYQTNKLFYGKYPYRVETLIPGASKLNFWGVDKTMAWCNGSLQLNHWETFTVSEKENLYRFAETLKDCAELGIKTRAEYQTYNLYCIDVKTYELIKQRFNSWIYSITEPATNDDLAKLSANPSQHLCKVLPYNRYTHKVFLRASMPLHQRLKFIGWLEYYKDTIKPSKGTVRWMRDEKSWLQDPFVYVDNPKQLTMVGMFLGNNLKKVQEFVLQDA